MADFPTELLYTKDHEWLRIKDTLAKVGVTSFAVEQLGDITMIELPNEGDEVAREEVFGTVESVKAVSDLFAPVSGVVKRVNSPLDDSPEYVNQDPYDEGWIIEIEMSDAAELDDLMDVKAYTAFVAEQDD